ncbi:MAG: 1-acyl-sn-glycerol-3-phosphate acyltransferase [Deltaproteobacteria bacterium]|nr:1-acyl-sn-glycerol-3-phosphate acyltransferase [Deltaproteobacteria bacterium]
MFARTAITWIVGAPITIFLFIVVLLSLLAGRGPAGVHRIAVLWCRIILGLSGVRVRVKGAERVPKDRTVIFLSNHSGAFDIPALQVYLPIEFRWVAKKSLFTIPLVGWAMSFAGYIGIERENAQEAYKSMEEAADKIKNGISVLVFPEGTRNATDAPLLPLKRGAFMLAARSGVDVVPVAIKGTRDIMKRGSLLIHPAKVEISFGHAMPTTGGADKTLRSRTKAAIEEMLAAGQ